MDHQPQVADRVGEQLGNDGPIGRDGAQRPYLVLDVVRGVLGRVSIETVFVPEPGHRVGDRFLDALGQFATETAKDRSQVIVTAGRVPLPEGHTRQMAGRRRDYQPVVGQFQHAPRTGAQSEDVAGTGLVDKLLV